jgi:hypothetical protein
MDLHGASGSPELPSGHGDRGHGQSGKSISQLVNAQHSTNWGGVQKEAGPGVAMRSDSGRGCPLRACASRQQQRGGQAEQGQRSELLSAATNKVTGIRARDKQPPPGSPGSRAFCEPLKPSLLAVMCDIQCC